MGWSPDGGTFKVDWSSPKHLWLYTSPSELGNEEYTFRLITKHLRERRLKNLFWSHQGIKETFDLTFWPSQCSLQQQTCNEALQLNFSVFMFCNFVFWTADDKLMFSYLEWWSIPYNFLKLEQSQWPHELCSIKISFIKLLWPWKRIKFWVLIRYAKWMYHKTKISKTWTR